MSAVEKGRRESEDMGEVVPFARPEREVVDTRTLESWLEDFGLADHDEIGIPSMALNAYHTLCRRDFRHPLRSLTDAVLDYLWAEDGTAFNQIVAVQGLISAQPDFRLGYIAWLNMVEQGWWEYEQGRLSRPVVPLCMVNTMIGEALDRFQDRRIIESALLAAQSASVIYERQLQNEVDRLYPELLKEMPRRFGGYGILV